MQVLKLTKERHLRHLNREVLDALPGSNQMHSTNIFICMVVKFEISAVPEWRDESPSA